MKNKLIQRKFIFGNSEKARAVISPSGEMVAYLAPYRGSLNIWIAPVSNLKEAQRVTAVRGRGLIRFLWAYTGEDLLFFQDNEGDEQWRIYTVNIKSLIVRRLTPARSVSARITGISFRHPEKIIVGINKRNRHFHDLYEVNIISGKTDLVYQNDQFCEFLTNFDLRPRIASKMNDDGSLSLYCFESSKQWREFDFIPMDYTMLSRFIGLDETGNILYMVDSRDGEYAMLVKVNLMDGTRQTLTREEGSDVEEVIRHPTTGAVQAVSFNYLKSRWVTIDKTIRNDIGFLEKFSDAHFTVSSRSVNDLRWVIEFESDILPRHYYIYNHVERSITPLFTSRPELLKFKLSKMYPVLISTRDNLELVSYITLPHQSHQERVLKPLKPLPMIVIVHGGPWVRDRWGFSPYHQWLANRGYAVLSINYRGSTGFGKGFVNDGNFEWGGKMHDDLIDGVSWAVSAGIADPKRIGIMGMSYGGYATLMALSLTPEVFACGVALSGPSNLVTFLNAIPSEWKPQIALFTSRVGEHRTSEGRKRLFEQSPISHVNSITKPLLLVHGDRDIRVKETEANRIANKLEKRKVESTYILFTDEGHGLVHPMNRLSFLTIAEIFLSKHLGGLFENPGKELRRASFEIRAGAQYLPILAGLVDDPIKEETI